MNIADYDVVVNGSDNFPTRYLVNDACVMLRKPLVDASILQWEGQATVFLPGRGCYRCLFPTPPPLGTVPSCAEGGILGAVAGFMGNLQAVATIKILLGRGEVLVNRLLVFRALDFELRTLRWARNPDCPACGDRPTITQLIDYEAFCGMPGREAVGAAEQAKLAVPEVSAQEARALLDREDAHLIDVRETWEWVSNRIPGATLIPMAEIPQRLHEIPRDRTIIVLCRTGRRSATVTGTLRQAGYERVYNMAGGIMEWMNQQYPVEKAEPGSRGTSSRLPPERNRE